MRNEKRTYGNLFAPPLSLTAVRERFVKIMKIFMAARDRIRGIRTASMVRGSSVRDWDSELGIVL